MKNFRISFLCLISLIFVSCERFEDLFKDEFNLVFNNIVESNSYWVSDNGDLLIYFSDNASFSATYKGLKIETITAHCFGGSGSEEWTWYCGMCEVLGWTNGFKSASYTIYEARSRNEMTISFSIYLMKSGDILLESPIMRIRRVDTGHPKLYASRSFLGNISPSFKEVHGVTADGASQILIAMDGSLKDVVEMTTYINGQPIDEVTDKERFGSLGKPINIDKIDKWGMLYTAPSIYEDQYINIEVETINKKGKQKFYKVPQIKIYKMGVGLIHGLFDNAENCFGGLREYLKGMGYEECQIQMIDYKWSNTSSFDYNTFLNELIGPKLKGLHDKLLDNGIVSTRYALVGHSMGGILSRLYAGQIDKVGVGAIITLDTPHWGSQLGDYGNFVLERISHTTPGVRMEFEVIERIWKSRPLVAIKDLATKSDAIKDLNDGIKNSTVGIPVHAINSDMEGFEEMDFDISELLPSSGLNPIIFFNIKAADLQIRNNESIIEDEEKVLDIIFGDTSHDGVVSGASQRGGLEDKYCSILKAPYKGHFGVASDAHHCRTNRWDVTYETITSLLTSPNNDPRFTKSGFKAPPSNLKSTTEEASNNEGYVFSEDESIYIDIKTWNEEFININNEEKRVLKVEIECSEEVVVNMLLLAFGDSDFNVGLCKKTYYIEIPKDYIGEIEIYAYGKTINDELVVDKENITL